MTLIIFFLILLFALQSYRARFYRKQCVKLADRMADYECANKILIDANKKRIAEEEWPEYVEEATK